MKRGVARYARSRRHSLCSFGETLIAFARGVVHFVHSSSRSLRSLGYTIIVFPSFRMHAVHVFSSTRQCTSNRPTECTQCMSSRLILSKKTDQNFKILRFSPFFETNKKLLFFFYDIGLFQTKTFLFVYGFQHDTQNHSGNT